MGLLSSLERRASTRAAWHPSSGDPELVRLLGGRSVTSGVNVTQQTALAFATLFACVRNISEDTAKLPFILYRRRSDGGRERAVDHPVYPVLHDVANAEMTAFQFRKTLTGHIATWGNAYAEKEFDGAGRLIGLWPLRPDKTWPERGRDGRLYFKTVIDGRGHVLPFDLVLHIPGFGSDGLQGYNLVRLHEETIGLGIAYRDWMGHLLGNNCRPDVVIQHPRVLTPEAKKNLATSWQERYGGLDKKERVAVLEEGVTIKEVGFPPEQAQYITGREFTALDVCSIFRMPPHKVAMLNKAATYASVEAQSIEYVVDTLGAWLVLWESEVSFRLLSPEERKVYYAEHLVDSLLRGDIVSRYAAYATARQNGWMNANEIRRRENMDPMGPQGDVYLVPLNMVPAQDVIDGNYAPKKDSPPDVSRQSPALSEAHRALLEAEAARVLRREEQDVTNLVRKGLGSPDLEARLEEFYRGHEAFAATRLEPVVRACAAVAGRSLPGMPTLGARFSLSKGGVLAALSAQEPLAALQAYYDARRATWPREFADSILASLEASSP